MISRKIASIIVFVIVCCQNSAAQVDTTRREFYPLGLGDLWQYRDEIGNISGTLQVAIVDTQLPDGRL
jgi:hypothetical protein